MAKNHARERAARPERTGTEERYPQTAEERPRVFPSVDIYETAGGLVLEADMPGVHKDDLVVKCDADTLTIQGGMKAPVLEGECLHEEFRVVDYSGSFTLSADIDAANISAELSEGVLRITLPKKPETQPRKIDVKPK